MQAQHYNRAYIKRCFIARRQARNDMDNHASASMRNAAYVFHSTLSQRIKIELLNGARHRH